MDENHHSLEDWIAFKPDIFNDVNHKSDKISFLVAFNDTEQSIAITCIEGTRRASDRRQKSIACSLSLQSLVELNKQLSLINPEIDRWFRSINDFICGQKSNSRLFNLFIGYGYGYGYGCDSIQLNDENCEHIKAYLETALEICGKKLLFALLFETEFLTDYEENIQELRLKGFENILNDSLKQLDGVISLRTNAETLLEMTTIYAIEDEVIANVSIALAELYNFQLQPFLQLRELSYNDMNKAKKLLNDNDLGVRVKKEAQNDCLEFEEQYLSSTEALQQLYQQYYRNTVELVAAQTERMRSDRNRFGQSAFETKGALNRLQKLEIFLSQEKLKLLNSIKVTKEFQRDQIEQQLNNNASKHDIQRIESEVYEAQIGVLDSKLDVISEEEKLIKSKIDILQTNIESDDNSLFFDAIEDEEELKSFNPDNQNIRSSDRNKLLGLKTKLNNLCRKRAIMRNKRKSLIAEKKSKQTKMSNEKENSEKHHRVVIKRNNKPVESISKDEKFREMRKTTLQRLRNYKLKSLLYDGKTLEQSEDNDEDIPLPPYPSNNSDNNDKIQSDLPPPPTELALETDESILNNNTAICIPNPPLAPPPPPPPPPPAPPLALNTYFSIPKINSGLITARPEPTAESHNKKTFSCLVDLNEILKMKNKLKPTQVKETRNESKNGENVLLHATLNRIRNVVQDSDGSDDEIQADDEFD